MPQSLHRTWAALAIAALAVLAVAFLAGRDFVRHVNVPCPGILIVEENPRLADSVLATLVPVPMETISPGSAVPVVPSMSGPAFALVYDKKDVDPKKRRFDIEYRDVRVLWREAGDAGCTCGTVPIDLRGDAPYDLALFRSADDHRYVVIGWKDHVTTNGVRAIFRIADGGSHAVQPDRILSRQHLPLVVALFALGALAVALLRSRKAMSYALRIHTWTEARLTPSGLIESDTGSTLGTLEQTRLRRLPPGPILVAPAALSSSGLYRDVPIIARRHAAEGTHARWAAGTMVRLRDARVLAIISALCALLAFGARIIA